MTKQIKIFEVDSYEKAQGLLPEIESAFIDLGLVVFRGHQFTREEQKNLAKLLGDKFSWNVNSLADPHAVDNTLHDGGQSIDPNIEYDLFSKDDYILDWHIEQVYYKSPPLAGLWNLEKLTCPLGHGNTRFVDSNELYGLFSREEQEFLSGSVVIWDKPAPGANGPFYTKVVESHPLSGIPILRVETDRGCYMYPTLYSLHGKSPTEEEITKLQELLIKLKTSLYKNEDIRYEQVWNQGDLLLVDFFRMYHAVMGGFKYLERLMGVMMINANIGYNSFYTEAPERN